MISVEIFNIKQFNCFFDVVSSTESIVLLFKPNGLYVNVLNKHHTCFYNVFYDNAFFGDYDVIDPVEIIVDSDEFYRVLDSARKGESLKIIFENDMIKYVFTKDDNKRIISTPVISEEYKIPHPPSLENPSCVTLTLDTLKDCMTDCTKLIKVGKVDCKIIDKVFVISSTNDDMVEYENKLFDSIVVGEDVVSQFTTEYIQDLLKFKDVNNIIDLHLGNSTPLVWNIVSDDKLVECSGLIAPRIENK